MPRKMAIDEPLTGVEQGHGASRARFCGPFAAPIAWGAPFAARAEPRPCRAESRVA